ncbi:hypothetical protein FORC53_4123 [Vibrio vulnificus]|uniref:Uncharacterized protein n=1 Tax=Vibrio vulnificus TaxID=672 RepID=A0AAN1PT51_VIBVL|nr:hypothetical protein FORC53_4123 [Vibrio vulnificus]
MFSVLAKAQHASLNAFCLEPRKSHLKSMSSIANTRLKKNGMKTKPNQECEPQWAMSLGWN